MRKLFFLAAAAVLNLSALTVVMPSAPDNAEKLALAELIEVLEKSQAQKVDIVYGKTPSKAIYLGNTSLAVKHQLDSGKMAKEEWCIKAVDGNLIINGGRNTGVIYAVLEFAEKELGAVLRG